MAKEFYTVVVADDEIELLDAVCEVVPWNDIGFQLVGRAGNGWDALQLVEQLRPDLLLTDIRMNFISGISLAKQVKELQPMTQIVFLSGYDDFEYAQKAIEYNVIRYLLKPIGMEDLTRELRQIHEKITENFQKLQPRKQQGVGWQTTLLSGLLDSFGEAPDAAKFLRESLIPEQNCPMWVLALSSRQDISYTVDVVLEKNFCSHSVYSGGRVLTLIAGGSFDKLPTALDELSQAIWRVLGIRGTMGISRRFDDLAKLSSACREAVDAQRLADPGSIQFVSTMFTPETAQQSIKDMSSDMEDLLKTGEPAELEVQLPRTIARWDGKDPVRQDILLVQVLADALKMMAENGDSQAVEELCRRSGIFDLLFSNGNSAEYTRRITALSLAARNMISEQRLEGMSLLCSKALDVINHDYMNEDLSLGSVSEQLHVSPNYLSANMKKYAGDTFINLLIKKRMEVAQELLTSENIRIYEVARRCGYSDQHYFSFCFKKYFGVSPAQLRRSEHEKAGMV